MNLPTNLKYTRSHEWVAFLEDGTARIGLTDFAQDSMGSIVFADLPASGDAVTVGERFADVESVKAVSEVFSPVTGTISAVNDAVAEAPEAINNDPYGAWLIEVSGITDQQEFLDAPGYQAVCAEGE